MQEVPASAMLEALDTAPSAGSGYRRADGGPAPGDHRRAAGYSQGSLSPRRDAIEESGGRSRRSGQRGAEPPGRHARLTAEHLGQMALVGEAGLLCNQGEGLVGSPHQGFCALEPALDDIALGTYTDRLLERAAEVIGAETCHPGKIAQG